MNKVATLEFALKIGGGVFHKTRIGFHDEGMRPLFCRHFSIYVNVLHEYSEKLCSEAIILNFIIYLHFLDIMCLSVVTILKIWSRHYGYGYLLDFVGEIHFVFIYISYMDNG